MRTELWLATYVDSTGIPRAYGISADKQDAAGIAMLELEGYRDERTDRREGESFYLRYRKVSSRIEK